MIRVTHTTVGLGRLRARLAASTAVAQAAAGGGLQILADDAADDVRQSLGQGGGTPSTPGSAPADPAGRIAAAIMVRGDPDRPRADLTVDLPYAADLEFGTTRMAARPFLRPAVLRAGHAAGSVLAAAVDHALKGRPR